MIIKGAATLTEKKENQDSFSLIHNERLQLHGIVVADGLGSFEYAKEASNFVCQNIKSLIEDIEDIQQFEIESIIKETKNQLVEYALSQNIEIREQVLGTTAIIVLHHNSPIVNKDMFKIAYLGNGAIWHLRGNFNHFDEGQLLPWNATNYLNPHSIQQDGKEALYKLFSLSTDENAAIPTVLSLRVDERFGDIIMICTDGVYSYDQVQVGKDNVGKTWISGETAMTLFYQELDKFFKEGEEDLTKRLEMYLLRLKEMEGLDDDATIAVMITPSVLNYQKRKYIVKDIN